MRIRLLIGAVVVLSCWLSANAASFTNGNFETGNASGWTIGAGDRYGIYNPLNPADFLPGGPHFDSTYVGHSEIVAPGTDPNTSGKLNTVYSGNYSWRVEDTTWGGYASVISQTVINYTDANIFFAWAAVLESAHGATDGATVSILLEDLTAGVPLITRYYNASTDGGGVDARFNYDVDTDFYWTPWQVEQLTVPTEAVGHDLKLTVLAADCEPTAHTGYLYLDGFGAVAPPPLDDAVPEPATIALMGSGLLAIVIRFRRA